MSKINKIFVILAAALLLTASSASAAFFRDKDNINEKEKIINHLSELNENNFEDLDLVLTAVINDFFFVVAVIFSVFYLTLLFHPEWFPQVIQENSAYIFALTVFFWECAGYNTNSIPFLS